MADQIQAVHLGHHPVAEDQRKLVVLKQVPGRRAVRRREDLMPPLLEIILQKMTGDRIILGDQDFHDRSPLRRALLFSGGSRNRAVPRTAAKPRVMFVAA